MIADGTFVEQVKQALEHFYDPAFLHKSPLMSMLGEQPSAKEAALALRSLLREAIEALRPPETAPFGQPAWLNYRLLWLHYIQLRGASAVSDELALSRATYYRHLQRALEAVAEIIWSNHQRAHPPQDQEARPHDPDATALQEAVKLARQSSRELFALNDTVREVEYMLAPLLEQRALQLVTHLPSQSPCVWANPTMLRQVLVNLITGMLEQRLEGALQLTLTIDSFHVVGRLSARKSPAAAFDADAWRGCPEWALGASVLEVYGGRLWLETPPGEEWRLELVWSLPLAQGQSILIVDDDEDTLRVYERYLGCQYALRVATDGSQLWQALSEDAPALIILDVLMPQEDGWVLLQQLKTLPETAHIPVLIYSVLSQPSLALSLGAAEVLRKPIAEQPLLSAVRRILAPDSAA